MKNQVAIRINYFVLSKSETETYGELDVDTFRDKLQEDYIVTFQKNVAERGGGNFIVEFLLSITLKDYLMIIFGGVAWDLVRSGTSKYLLRPFIEKYQEFRKKQYAQEIRDIVFTFSDTKIHIYSIQSGEPEVSFASVSKIFQKLAIVYNKLDMNSTNKLTDIHIPIFNDTSVKTETIYRQKLSVDEPLESNTDNDIFKREAYLGYWGLVYFNYQRKVFSLEDQTLIDCEWYLEDEYYWKEN